MKLLFTVPWNARLGGAEMMLWTYLRHMDAARQSAIVVFFSPGPFEREVAALPGVTTEVIQTGRLRQAGRTASAVARLAALIRRTDPDLVVNWAASAQIYGAAAATMAGKGDRVVWWQHAIPSGHHMERLATLMPARAVGCSSTAAARAQALAWPRREVFVTNPGAEPRTASPLPRAELGIPQDRTVIGIVGRLQPWKGQHRVIRALADLRQRGFSAHALVVGGDAHGLSPDYGPSLEALIDELDLRDRVTLTGHVSDPLPYIGVMDILVNASEGEPFGIVTIEGMSQGVAVVAVGDGGAVDIVEPGRTGVLIERADEVLLTDALAQLIRHPAQREVLAEAGRTRFLERFTAYEMARRLEHELAALSSERR